MIFIQVNIHIFLWLRFSLICMKWQPADYFIWLQSLHLNYLLCLFKIWTCHIQLYPPRHLSVCVFFHCNFLLFSSVGIHGLFLEFIKRECVVWVENCICMLERGLRVFVGFGKYPSFFFLLGGRSEKRVIRRNFWKGEK